MINSSIVKLGRLSRAETVYRGLSGAMLPTEFWQKNKFNVSGGVETSFMSTTTDRKVAMHYASTRGGNAARIVIEIQQGMVNKRFPTYLVA